MNHQLKTVFVIIVLLSITTITGVLIGQSSEGGTFFNNVKLLFGAEGITGAATGEVCEGDQCPPAPPPCQDKSGQACRIACFSNDDCNDKIEATEDICRNPGTEFSVCVNRVRK